MKNGNRPTLRQKLLMMRWLLDPNDWLVVKDTPGEMLVVHRYPDHAKMVIRIWKGEKDD